MKICDGYIKDSESNLHHLEAYEGGGEVLSQEKTCLCGQFDTVYYQLNSDNGLQIVGSRTEVKSAEVSIEKGNCKFFKSFLVSLFFLVLLMVAEVLYK